jgi:DNA-binding NtrC family response regulator
VAEFDDPEVTPSPIAAETPPAATNGSADDDKLGLKELGRRAAATAEREVLKRTLEHVHWRRVEAAQRLRSSDKTLREKIKDYGLDCPDDEL